MKHETGDFTRRAALDRVADRLTIIRGFSELLRDGATLSDEDRELIAQLIVGAGEQVGRWWLTHREVPPDQVKARFAAAVAEAINSLERG